MPRVRRLHGVPYIVSAPHDFLSMPRRAARGATPLARRPLPNLPLRAERNVRLRASGPRSRGWPHPASSASDILPHAYFGRAPLTRGALPASRCAIFGATPRAAPPACARPALRLPHRCATCCATPRAAPLTRCAIYFLLGMYCAAPRLRVHRSRGALFPVSLPVTFRPMTASGCYAHGMGHILPPLPS